MIRICIKLIRYVLVWVGLSILTLLVMNKARSISVENNLEENFRLEAASTVQVI